MWHNAEKGYYLRKHGTQWKISTAKSGASYECQTRVPPTNKLGPQDYSNFSDNSRRDWQCRSTIPKNKFFLECAGMKFL